MCYKQCKICELFLTLDNFHKNKRTLDKLEHRCKKCKEKQARIRYDKIRKNRVLLNLTPEQTKQRAKEYHKKYRNENKDRLQQNKKISLNKVKKEGILHYGGKCTCCGESQIEFLTIEHKNKRVEHDYKPSGKRRTGKQMWRKIKVLGYPDNYTILCFNCNCAKGAFGICPHQKNIEDNNWEL